MRIFYLDVSSGKLPPPVSVPYFLPVVFDLLRCLGGNLGDRPRTGCGPSVGRAGRTKFGDPNTPKQSRRGPSVGSHVLIWGSSCGEVKE